MPMAINACNCAAMALALAMLSALEELEEDPLREELVRPPLLYVDLERLLRLLLELRLWLDEPPPPIADRDIEAEEGEPL